jgi:hypothetical protein
MFALHKKTSYLVGRNGSVGIFNPSKDRLNFFLIRMFLESMIIWAQFTVRKREVALSK